MFEVIKARYHQGHRTNHFPEEVPRLPERYRGLPKLDSALCPTDCRACVEACPTGAIQRDPLEIDTGKCLFCPRCVLACPRGAVTFTRNHRLCANTPDQLKVGPEYREPAIQLDEKLRALFGRSLQLRQVSAGGCNACEADINVLATLAWDLGRFGIKVVASPRHADGLVITGPVSKNMEFALRETYDAVPSPKLVIAVGACAISGGSFAGSNACVGIPPEIPVDLYIPGCPPHPLTILDGFLRLIGRIK